VHPLLLKVLIHQSELEMIRQRIKELVANTQARQEIAEEL
jgi:hypothetical protein